ncbi:MAG TPA: phosphoribosylanthranilate isomerase [Terriglobales bacterium]|nr:phosphoribosylanthranilate isomerase [Terriglobales bacterium]
MTWVKICGITNLEDALVAVEAGADALGFVFYDKSPRYVGADRAATITEKLPEQLEKVGVFARNPAEDLIDLAWRARLTAFQFHMFLEGGNGTNEASPMAFGLAAFPKPPKFFAALPAALLLDGRLNANFSTPEGVSRPAGIYDTVFLDSSTATQPGGTGVAFDWRAAAPAISEMKRQVKVVIAGGLRPENVSEAINILHPWGVDVSSGVESRPGKKDPAKVRAFIKAVREADKASSN